MFLLLQTLILTDENSKTGGDPLRQKRGSGERQFIFDNVFGEDATQVWQTIQSIKILYWIQILIIFYLPTLFYFAHSLNIFLKSKKKKKMFEVISI